MVAFAVILIGLLGLLFIITSNGHSYVMNFLNWLPQVLSIPNDVMTFSPSIISGFCYFVVFFCLVALIVKLIPFVG